MIDQWKKDYSTVLSRYTTQQNEISELTHQKRELHRQTTKDKSLISDLRAKIDFLEKKNTSRKTTEGIAKFNKMIVQEDTHPKASTTSSSAFSGQRNSFTENNSKISSLNNITTPTEDFNSHKSRLERLQLKLKSCNTTEAQVPSTPQTSYNNKAVSVITNSSQTDVRPKRKSSKSHSFYSPGSSPTKTAPFSTTSNGTNSENIRSIPGSLFF